ncbi:galactose-1-phosphate uridylyltransferase [Komarekiella sp. 'clone 1']|uniref:Galactose-1-phosphate uridylyltransferase n=1 Tax=Komarekiella delphini-convector SJRDD-AB1 TaxID=2593771 RepID=A0AA40T083_9NOST|nr:galactose-1-phosphate uridylyltransferase [Komarekiella delphini-convector]MBD6618320.1 galactose-1-phosphate uridylyltransferase [Komarekiella delphini-convector SJRDD-AB1]
MYSHQLLKPDGRQLTLYSRFPIAEAIIATGSSNQLVQTNSHLRWHPLRGEWVVYASYHQEQTFLPPPEYNLLASSNGYQLPTELPPGRYDVAVFDNRFPVMTPSASDSPECIVETLPANGVCETVVFTQNPQASLSSLELDHLALLLEVWGDRTLILGANQQIQYVLPFDNRDAKVGITLPQQHGEIYAYPFIPPIPARMLEMQRRFYHEHHRGLLTDLIQKEIAQKKRIIYQDEYAIAFVPVCARYPYEVWIAPIEPVSSLFELTAQQRWGLAKALKTVTLKYDGLLECPFSCSMTWFQAPTDGKIHPEAHLYAELYPADRTLTGSELAGGVFTNNALPEEKAKDLQAVIVNIKQTAKQRRFSLQLNGSR